MEAPPITGVVYDIETYPNVFTMVAIDCASEEEFLFEISDRINDGHRLVEFLRSPLLKNMIGFNNINFDYPVIHFIDSHIRSHHSIDALTVYKKAMSIIDSRDNKFKHIIWENDRIVPQIDLFKVHHFDNMARSTSLKRLEFNMRSESVIELPYNPSKMLLPSEIDNLIEYNRYDVLQTLKFFRKSYREIELRKNLTEKYNKDFMNKNDPSIGSDFFIMNLEKINPGCCYRKINGKKKIVQTHRSKINLDDIILPFINFETLELKNVLTFLKSKTINQTKGVFNGLTADIGGIKAKFGTGGIHASVDNTKYEACNGYIIEDWDVTSYYPQLAVKHNFHPEHLGESFCHVYQELFEERKKHKKGTPENAMLKLALNGVYGKSNSTYSPFYDPQYTMSITINGQLLLCMICEKLTKNPKIQLIQMNTDGFTLYYPEEENQYVLGCVQWWEALTHLSLESARFKRMFIRDVSSYLCELSNGEIKRKGAYNYEKEWHENHSALIIPKAAEQYLLYGVPIKGYIMSPNRDVFDFMLNTKVNKNCHLYHGEKKVQRLSRYYISNEGLPLTKIHPPNGPLGKFKLKHGISPLEASKILEEVGDEWDERIHMKSKTRYEVRPVQLNVGYLTTIVNEMPQELPIPINYEYYIGETKKLTEVFEDD